MLNKEVKDAAEVNQKIKDAINADADMKKAVQYNDRPIVSSDIIGTRTC
jgi:glyceraldehyde-3-phosphate dehydrogenase/erythrose-4-phosphate dehydrogenase